MLGETDVQWLSRLCPDIARQENPVWSEIARKDMAAAPGRALLLRMGLWTQSYLIEKGLRSLERFVRAKHGTVPRLVIESAGYLDLVDFMEIPSPAGLNGFGETLH
jgi:hypothetical protein